jgi:hypothetical protein
MKKTLEVIEAIRRVAAGAPISNRDLAALRSPPLGATLDASIANDIGFHGEDLGRAAALALDIQRGQHALREQIRDLALEEKPRVDDPEKFINRVRLLRGAPDVETCAAFDLAPTASWARVADRIESMLSPKKRAA